jgi:DNA-binding transcriptional regulator YiaG
MPKLKITLKKQAEPEEQAVKDILKEDIKKFRHRRGLSQFALAAKLDISTDFCLH